MLRIIRNDLVAILVLSGLCMPSWAEAPTATARPGLYSLQLDAVREGEANMDGDKVPQCGDGARKAFESASRLKIVYSTKKESITVNGDEWTILRNRSGTFAAKALTSCTSFSLRFIAEGTSKASGSLVYVSRCAELPACASRAEYKGTFSLE